METDADKLDWRLLIIRVISERKMETFGSKYQTIMYTCVVILFYFARYVLAEEYNCYDRYYDCEKKVFCHNFLPSIYDHLSVKYLNTKTLR